MTAEEEGAFEGLRHPVGDEVGGVDAALDQNGELVTTEPGHGIAGAHGPLQPLADADQQVVAHRMTQVVVD